ncbi:sialidase family protein [Paraburkholderia sediminicola]
MSIAAESLAQATATHAPGQIIAHSTASTGIFLGSPSLAVLPNGTYVASYDTFGPHASPDHVVVFASRDKGISWSRLGDVPGAYWSTLFVSGGALYMFGTNRSMGTPVIRRSNDGGSTWTTPVDQNTGKFPYPGRFLTGPVPVLVDQGRIWRAFEIVQDGDLKALLLSAPANSNLLDTRNWTRYPALGSDKTWLSGHFLSWEEGNVVATPHAPPVLVLRVNTRMGAEKVALVPIDPYRHTMSFNPTSDFIPFPGGGKKFTIRFDARTQRYWSITNAVPQNPGRENLERVRNTLALTSSSDLRNWRTERVLLQNADALKHGFQYVDWQFDGNDIIAVVRMAFDDAEGGAHNQHDSNYISFVRFPNLLNR